MTIPRVLTNKTVLTGFQNTFLKSCMPFKPAFGDASKMGKVLGTAPAAEAGVMQGSFRGDINSFLQITPSGLGQPRHILTKTV